MGCLKKSDAMVVVRLVGGIGNQIFQYAMARRLTIKNNVPLKLDSMSGFHRDCYYHRRYSLGCFDLKQDFALADDCFLGPFGRGHRGFLRFRNHRRPHEQRVYICEEFLNCDDRLLNFKVTRKIYLEGYWQSERYFKDIETVLRKDLQFKSAHTPENIALAKKIKDSESICLHVRRLRATPYTREGLPDFNKIRVNEANMDYYQRAIAYFRARVHGPHFFVFSDDPAWCKANFSLGDHVTFVEHNRGYQDCEDLWLMSVCKYFIIAYSSFSWWGAWLSTFPGKTVIAPFKEFDNKIDLMPAGWLDFSR